MTMACSPLPETLLPAGECAHLQTHWSTSPDQLQDYSTFDERDWENKA